MIDRLVTKLCNWISLSVCTILGHMPVARGALPSCIANVLDKDVDAVCLRCRRQYRFTKAMADSVFAPSPLLERIREKYPDFGRDL